MSSSADITAPPCPPPDAADGLRRRLRIGFLLLLLLPAAQTIVPFIHDPKLEGVETVPPPLVWSPRSWGDGSLVSGLDLRLRRAIGFRPVSVRLMNQAKLAFRDERFTLDNDEVLVGKDDWLFGRTYLRHYTDPARQLSDEALEQFVRQLKTLQDRLAQRGTVFVVVISPSKCELYPEYLPDEFVAARRRNDCRRDYDVGRELLTAAGVNVVDGPAVLRRLKERGVEQLFSRTGVHWSYHACLHVWRDLLTTVNAVSALDLPVPEIVGLTYDRARHADHDLGKMVNAFVPPGGRPLVPYPVVETAPLPVRRRPNVLFIGSSFCWTLMDALYVSGSGREVDIFYYNRTHYRGPDGGRLQTSGEKFPRHPVCSLEAEPPDWERTLMEKDIVVLEMLEFMFLKKGWDFCGPALDALEQYAHVPPRRRQPPTRIAVEPGADVIRR